MGTIINAICSHCGETYSKDSERNSIRYCSARCRLYSKTKPGGNGCLEWTGTINAVGRPVLTIGKKTVLAYRYAYSLERELPESSFVCHTCDNPLCLNINHLWLGDWADNNWDASKKMRNRHGDKHHFTKIPDSELGNIIGSKKTNAELAAIYGVSRTAIQLIKSRRRKATRIKCS